MFVSILLVAAALAGTADFNAAYGAAFDAAGTDEFRSAINRASVHCTPDVKGCVDKIVELIKLDQEQKAYLRTAPRLGSATEPDLSTGASAKVEPDVLEFDLEDEDEYEIAAPAARARAESDDRTAVYDRPTGLDYIASLSPPPYPWTGLQVSALHTALPEVQRVCVLRGGVPLVTGNEALFSFSHVAGSAVFACPAAGMIGDVIYVPNGAMICLAKGDPLRQVFVVEKAYTCTRSVRATERVVQKSITGCISQRIR